MSVTTERCVIEIARPIKDVRTHLEAFLSQAPPGHAGNTPVVTLLKEDTVVQHNDANGITLLSTYKLRSSGANYTCLDIVSVQDTPGWSKEQITSRQKEIDGINPSSLHVFASVNRVFAHRFEQFIDANTSEHSRYELE